MADNNNPRAREEYIFAIFSDIRGTEGYFKTRIISRREIYLPFADILYCCSVYYKVPNLIARQVAGTEN